MKGQVSIFWEYRTLAILKLRSSSLELIARISLMSISSRAGLVEGQSTKRRKKQDTYIERQFQCQSCLILTATSLAHGVQEFVDLFRIHDAIGHDPLQEHSVFIFIGHNSFLFYQTPLLIWDVFDQNSLFFFLLALKMQFRIPCLAILLVPNSIWKNIYVDSYFMKCSVAYLVKELYIYSRTKLLRLKFSLLSRGRL